MQDFGQNRLASNEASAEFWQNLRGPGVVAVAAIDDRHQRPGIK